MKPSVHDAFFKAMLSQPEQAASLLRLILPLAIAARVDFSALALCSGSFVDEALKERQSDLLFSAPLGGRPATIYVLLEHQSRVDGQMAFRLLRYMVRIWEACAVHSGDQRTFPARGSGGTARRGVGTGE